MSVPLCVREAIILPRRKQRSVQVYFRVPESDEVVLEWLDAQDSPSASLRELVRRQARAGGIRDIISMSMSELAMAQGMQPVYAQPMGAAWPQDLAATESDGQQTPRRKRRTRTRKASAKVEASPTATVEAKADRGEPMPVVVPEQAPPAVEDTTASDVAEQAAIDIMSMMAE